MSAAIYNIVRKVTEEEVKRAYAVVRGLKLAELADTRLAEDSAHRAAKDEAQERFERLFGEMQK